MCVWPQPLPSQLDDLELRPAVIETLLSTDDNAEGYHGGPSHNVRVSAQQTVAGRRSSSAAAHSGSRGVPRRRLPGMPAVI